MVRCLPQSIVLIQIVKKWKEGGPRMEKKSGISSNIRSYLGHFRRSYKFYKKKITYYLLKVMKNIYSLLI